ncbi:hypothetical protein [Symbioplanes lichenis]|uniref:hypothetical protein n=1 Tax=Symbioplanes lichenis TaxID=1629072 RepID=UPI0027396B48|nr:hypothetical protein [Actinoplanes lichenis]
MTDPQEADMTDLALTPEVAGRQDVELDTDLLEEAQRQISASRNEALNEGLRLLVEKHRERRRLAGEALERMVENGELDFR